MAIFASLLNKNKEGGGLTREADLLTVIIISDVTIEIIFYISYFQS